MSFFSELIAHVEVLRRELGDDIEPAELAQRIADATDEAVVTMISETSAVIHASETLRIIASGVAAQRSTRTAGHSGLSQTRGHRSPVSLVQEITGTTRADAAKHVRLGESMLATALGQADQARPADDITSMATGADRHDDAGGDAERPAPWHAPLDRALLAGALTSAQHDVILRGLGAPPAAENPTCACADSGASCVCVRTAVASVRDAWSAAAEQLVDEALCRTVEELARAARSIRDHLDPIGADERFRARFEARSFRMRLDENGTHRGYIAFDDEGAAWFRSILDAALRPRRGGPRFVDPEEERAAEALVADPRTNDQLAYDLLIDVLRAGTLADARAVFGTRQVGVRLVTIVDRDQAVTHLEDDGTTLPAWLAAQHTCDTATVPCTVDRDGNPLDLGREARLFSPKQKLMLAIRDGGCLWNGCDRPASYCEAHHIDPYAEGGKTDIDRGILLCRFHHMQLHNRGWRVTRDGINDFALHPPHGGLPTILKPRAALAYAWAGIDPPPRRFRRAA
jgi:hypothetical protein